MAGIYSLTKINELAGNDKAFVRELVKTFLEEIPLDIDNLKNAVSNNNPPMAYQYAHKMKPSFQLFEVDVLRQIKSLESWEDKEINAEQAKSELDSLLNTTELLLSTLKIDFM